MAIRKVRIRPEGGNNYADVLHPETSADVVIESENKMFVSSAEKANWNNKAEKTYVDTELNKRYLKEQVFTKEEVLQKIQDVIGVAPEALDTLQEIAEALNNDANFAGTITNELSKKVDKIEGKQLSTEDYTTEEKNKLAGIADGANNYIHPSTHPASMITEDSTHRFTTDTEKNNWNDANSKKHTHSNKAVLDIITQTLVDTWNSAVSHIGDTIKHITSDERTLWNTVTNKSDITHTHDDRYYTENEINSKFVSKSEFQEDFELHKNDNTRHISSNIPATAITFGGKFQIAYNSVTNSLDITVVN